MIKIDPEIIKRANSIAKKLGHKLKDNFYHIQKHGVKKQSLDIHYFKCELCKYYISVDNNFRQFINAIEIKQNMKIPSNVYCEKLRMLQ